MRSLIVIACCVAVLRAQQTPPFRAETRNVQIPVTVTDTKGKFVEGLTLKDFVVHDDSAARAITLDLFGSGAAPISLVVAIQTSGLAAPALAKIRRTGSLIQPLVIGHRGEAAVLTFDSSVEWLQDFTGHSELIQQCIKNLTPAGDAQARMLDAVIEAATRLRDRPGRRVMLLISESRDRGSQAKLEDAMEAVEREGVEVFAAPFSVYATTFAAKPEQLPPPSAGNYLAVFREMARLGKTNHVQALTQATGGAEYPFTRERSAEKAIENLGAEVHSQYILSFPQGAVRAGMHQIDVSVPGRAELRVRARRAYWAE